MAKNKPWTENEKKLAIKMYADGYRNSAIAKAVGRTYTAICKWISNNNLTAKKIIAKKQAKDNKKAKLKKQQEFAREMKIINVAKRSGDKVERSNEYILQKEREERQRMMVYTMGLSDTDSAVECGIAYSTYREWRRSRKLPVNEKVYVAVVKKEEPKRVAFTEDDVKYYKHNTHDKPTNTPGPVLIRVDKEEVEARCRAMKLDKPVDKLNRHPTVPMLGGQLLGFDHVNHKLSIPATTETYKIRRSSNG